MTDLETTGALASLQEIIEIGLVVFDPITFKILDTMNANVKPEHIETATPEAIAYNGYTPENWMDALALAEAMKIYGEKTQGAVFCSYNVSFDWAFIAEAFHRSNLPNPMMTRENHDRLDVLTLAWDRGLKREKSFSLRSDCTLFGIPPEPDPHSALNGAMTAYELWRKLNTI